MLRLTRDLGNFHNVSERSLKLPHRLLRVVHFNIFYFHSHAVRRKRLFPRATHTVLFYVNALAELLEEKGILTKTGALQRIKELQLRIHSQNAT